MPIHQVAKDNCEQHLILPYKLETVSYSSASTTKIIDCMDFFRNFFNLIPRNPFIYPDGERAYISGGSIFDWFMGREIKDIDIYFASVHLFSRTFNYICRNFDAKVLCLGLNNITIELNELEFFSLNNGRQDKLWKIDLILPVGNKKWFHPSTLFYDFDLVNVQAAMDYDNFYCHTKYFNLLETKEIKLNSPTHDRKLIWPYRVMKYIEKGLVMRDCCYSMLPWMRYVDEKLGRMAYNSEISEEEYVNTQEFEQRKLLQIEELENKRHSKKNWGMVGDLIYHYFNYEQEFYNPKKVFIL